MRGQSGSSTSGAKVSPVILLMEEMLHQLMGIVYTIIYKVLYIPGGEGFLPSNCSIPVFHSNLI